MTDLTNEPAFTTRDIDQAIDRDQLELWFQPQYELSNRTIGACEGMVRWRHPDLGLLPPGLFIQSFEAHDRMADLTKTVARLGGHALKRWREAGHDWRLNLNVTVADLVSPSFAILTETELQSAGGQPDSVTFEVREDDAACHVEDVERAARALRRAGFGFALEARGTRLMPDHMDWQSLFTEFKLTGPTLLRMGAVQRRAGGGLVGARLDEAKRAGLPVVAVGAENEKLIGQLTEMGFDRAQGHALAPAAPLREILANAPAAEACAQPTADEWMSMGLDALIREARSRDLDQADVSDAKDTPSDGAVQAA